MKPFIKRAFFLVVIALMSCGVAWASDVNFYTINFNPSMPSKQDDFKSSLNAPWDTYENLLKIDASLLKSQRSKYRFKVVGFTDSHECTGDECIALSLRRATFVYKWLLTNGVASDELDPPEGRGTATPLDNNETESGRLRNRRVEIDFITN